jgi:hypothetical protein
MSDFSTQNVWHRLRKIAFAATASLALCAGAFGVDKQLPSCTVTGDQLSNVASEDWVFVQVDSHGNFYQIHDPLFGGTPLTRFGVPVWHYVNFGFIPAYYQFHQTKGLEEKVCAVGKKIVFRIDVPRAYGAQYIGVRPKPYIVIREFSALSRDPDAGTDHPRRRYDIYFLSAFGYESDLILDVGVGLATSSNGFRLPRVGDDLVPVYRFYGSVDGVAPSHYYTADSSEIAAIRQSIASGAKYVEEGVAFFAPKATKTGSSVCHSPDTVPVLRMYSPAAAVGDPQRYRYVTDTDLAQSMLNAGWINQGASFCALPE